MSAENLSAEKIQALKAEISMLQRKNQTINKEEEKIDKVKRNLLMEKQQQHEILEECSDDGEKEEAVKKYYSSKEYEQFIIEASDPVISDDDIEEEEYFKDPRDVALQDAYDRIKMLENEIVKLRNTAQTDDTYILELERELETLSSPRRRIQFLENQVENVRHQYSNLSAQFRRKEESEREKLAAYETIKKNFLTHLMKMNSEKDELLAALEAKNKENEQLRKIISQYQTSAKLSTSQISGNLSTSNTQTTEESMDLSNPPSTPNNNDAIVANVSPKKKFSVKRKLSRFMLLMPFSLSNSSSK